MRRGAARWRPRDAIYAPRARVSRSRARIWRLGSPGGWPTCVLHIGDTVLAAGRLMVHQDSGGPRISPQAPRFTYTRTMKPPLASRRGFTTRVYNRVHCWEPVYGACNRPRNDTSPYPSRRTGEGQREEREAAARRLLSLRGMSLSTAFRLARKGQPTPGTSGAHPSRGPARKREPLRAGSRAREMQTRAIPPSGPLPPLAAVTVPQAVSKAKVGTTTVRPLAIALPTNVSLGEGPYVPPRGRRWIDARPRRRRYQL